MACGEFWLAGYALGHPVRVLAGGVRMEPIYNLGLGPIHLPLRLPLYTRQYKEWAFGAVKHKM